MTKLWQMCKASGDGLPGPFRIRRDRLGEAMQALAHGRRVSQSTLDKQSAGVHNPKLQCR